MKREGSCSPEFVGFWERMSRYEDSKELLIMWVMSVNIYSIRNSDQDILKYLYIYSLKIINPLYVNINKIFL